MVRTAETQKSTGKQPSKRKLPAETTTIPSTNVLITPMAGPGAIPGSVLGTFSDLPQLSQFWYDSRDKDVLESHLIDLVNTTDSTPSKTTKTKSGQTAAEARTISHLNTGVMNAAFLLAYNTIVAETTKSDNTGDVTQPAKLAMITVIHRIKSSLSLLGHSDAIVSMVVDGARSLLQYRRLRDERYKTVEKLKKDLERVTQEIANISRSYESPKVWQVPRLTLNDSKVLVVEDATIAREHELADKAMKDLNTIAALAQEWTNNSPVPRICLETNSAKDDKDADQVTSAPKPNTTTPPRILLEDIVRQIGSQGA